MHSQKLQESIDYLVSQDFVHLSKEQVYKYLEEGSWTEKTFVDYLEEHAQNKPDQVAFINDDGSRITFKELNDKANQFAYGLLQTGMKPGDRIAVQLPNILEFVITLVGSMKIRVLPVLCHMPYNEKDLDYIFELSEASAIVILDEFNKKNYIKMIQNFRKNNNHLKEIIVISEKNYEGTLNFYSLLERQYGSVLGDLTEMAPVGTDPAFVMFTSGTTGRPKAVYHLHANNIFFGKILNDELAFNGNDSMLVTPPLAHLTGLAVGVLAPIIRGGTSVLLSGWNAEKAANLVEKEKISYFLSVTPMLIDFINLKGLENKDISSLTDIVYAGAPCPAEVLKVYSEKYNCDIKAFYGYSEAGITHSTKTGDDISITSKSFGKVIDGVESKILDDDGNIVTPPGQGEVVSRGPNFIPGYYRQPEITRKQFDEEGWFHSSDLVQIDENGYCIFLARKDDLINRGGYKIDPREVEEALFTHPNIREVVVVAMPDPRLGERIAAFLTLKENMEALSLQDITSFLGEKGIAKQHWPEAVKVIEQFPMTASGKVQRFVLREMARELNQTQFNIN